MGFAALDPSYSDAVASFFTRCGYLSSQTSSMRQPLKRLLVIVVSPLSCGCMQVANRE